MKFTLLTNLAAFALFCALTACFGLCRWELLLFQLVLQVLTNEFWIDLFLLPFRGQHLYGAGLVGEKLADPARVRRVARWTASFLLVFPALVLGALACINYWGGSSLGEALHVPMDGRLFVSCLAAQGLLCVLSLVGGLVPLSYRTVFEALMARRERRLMAEGRAQPSMPDSASVATPAPAPTHAGVEMLPHGLPEGVVLPAALNVSQRCSPMHAHHAEIVREKLREGEVAVLSTAPAGVVSLPNSSNERLLGGILLCLGALLLYVAIGLFEDGSSRIVTRWVVLLLGLGLLPTSVRVLRSSARRQALLRRTDYFITNYRVHACRAGEWKAVNLVSMEVLIGGTYGEGRGDVELCPESGPDTYKLINVEHAEELCELLERLIYMENAR